MDIYMHKHFPMKYLDCLPSIGWQAGWVIEEILYTVPYQIVHETLMSLCYYVNYSIIVCNKVNQRISVGRRLYSMHYV